MMRKDRRFSYSDRNFRKYVLPILKIKYPGYWISTMQLPIDFKNCIDYIYSSKIDPPMFFATRVWMSKPYQNHCVRYRKSTAPDIDLEVGIMLRNLKDDRLIPDLTVEAWVHDKYIYIAISDSRALWTYIRDNIDNLPTIKIKNPVGYTEFLKVDFDRLPYKPHTITIPNFFNQL